MVVYMTRSIHPLENENIVEEVKDFLGSGWKLEPVFPELSDNRHYNYEIGISNSYDLDEALKIAPSLEFGNGIFLAAFKRWNKDDQEEARLIEVAKSQTLKPMQLEVKKKKKVSSYLIQIRKLQKSLKRIGCVEFSFQNHFVRVSKDLQRQKCLLQKNQ